MDEKDDLDFASTSSQGDTKDSAGDPRQSSAGAVKPDANKRKTREPTQYLDTVAGTDRQHPPNASPGLLYSLPNTPDPRPGPTTIEQAISTGNPHDVSALLDTMDDASAIRQLTGSYGGGRHENDAPGDDDNSLFNMTVPLLHAAYSGNVAMFSTVHGAMRTKLRVQQVKRAVAARDYRCRSLIAMAALSKNKDMVRAALAALEEHLTTDEVKEVMMAGSYHDCNAIIWAAASGCKDVFEATVEALRNRLSLKEVVRMMVYDGTWDSTYANILKAAASSGDKDTWDAVCAELDGNKVEVKKYLMAPDCFRNETLDPRTVLLCAVRSASVPTFEAVLDVLIYHLAMDERKEVMNAGPMKLLHAAAESGSKSMFEAVLAALVQAFEPYEVDKMARYDRSYGLHTLEFAAKSGNKGMIEAVVDVVGVVRQDKVWAMMMPSSEIEGDGDACASVLHAAAHSGSKEMFEAVLAAMEKRLTPDEVRTAVMSTGYIKRYSTLDAVGDYHRTILHSAAHSGSKAVVEAVLATMDDKLDSAEVERMLTFTGDTRFGRSILHSAAMSGSKDVFEALLAVVVERMPSVEVERLVMSTSEQSRGLLEAAVNGGSIQLLHAVVLEVGSGLMFEENEVEHLLLAAAGACCAGMWEALTEISTKLWKKRFTDSILQKAELVLKDAICSMDSATVRAVWRSVRELLPVDKASETLGKVAAHGFVVWVGVVLGTDTVRPSRPVGSGGLGWSIEVLSCILEYAAVLDPNELVKLSRKASSAWLSTCFLETVAGVQNPFVAGITLSVALAKSAVVAPEGERRKLSSLQNKLDGLLLEILERLPQTVQGFHGGMAGCAAVFEPEVKEGNASGFLGPLRMVMQNRGHMEIFCTQPLIVDFLTRRFSYCLPNLVGTKGLPSDDEELVDLANGAAHCHNLVIDVQDKISVDHIPMVLGQGRIPHSLLSPCVMLQGVCPKRMFVSVEKTSLSIFPGVQFLSAGLVAIPEAYYRVPDMRMTLDVIVYVGMLAVFSAAILLHDDGPLTTGEIAFAFYVLAGAIKEVREMRMDFNLYAADHWNPIDFLGLGLVAGGLVVRIADHTSSWGRALYALSAPLLFSRILFFAQILRFQGPMIQVIFGMIGELVKFGIVILVIMFGFAMSFYALFRDIDTFGQTFLTLFKGTLGEVEYFDEFVGGEYSEYEEVATALFILYLIVIAIMLLNLLIAVLSTAHAKVQEKAEQEFRVSRARLIDHYRLVVDKHLLPPPFNLVQLVVSLPFCLVDGSWHGESCTRAKKAVGRLVFWLVMGAVAVVGGTVLWLVSAVYSPFKWHRSNAWTVKKLPSVSIALRHVVVFMWCVVGAPLYLFMFWVTGPLKWMGMRPLSWLWNQRRLDPRRMVNLKSLHDMLRDCPGGLSVGELQEFLEDPMSDPEVRQDEKSRLATVEHMKQLRDRVEKTNDSSLRRRMKHVDARLDRLQQEFGATLEKVDRKLDGMLAVPRIGQHAGGVGDA